MSVMEEHRAKTRRSFPDKFKRDAVAMVLDDDNTIADVAGRLGHCSCVQEQRTTNVRLCPVARRLTS